MAERDIIANLVVKGGEQFVQTVQQSAKAEEQLGKSIDKTTDSIKENEAANKALLDKIKLLEAELAKTSANLKETQQNFDKLAVSEKNANTETSFLVKEIEKLKKEQEQLVKTLESLNKKTDENKTKTKSAAQELSAFKEQLIQLERQGKKNTKEYTDLNEKAAALGKTISGTSKEIREAGSDTRGLDKALRAATVLTGAFTAVQGAAALFGKDSDNLQKSLLKVQAALSVLNGLQAIQAELLRKDSLFTAALTRAKAAYSAAVAAATGATRGFSAALIATSIGAVVVAIGLLVANWDKLVDAIKRATGAQDENTEAQKRAAAERERQRLILSSEIQLELKRADLLESQGKAAEARLTREVALRANLQNQREQELELEQRLSKAQSDFQKELAVSAFNIRRLAEARRDQTEAATGATISEEKINRSIEQAANAIREKYIPQITDLTLKLNEQGSAVAGAEIAIINLDEKQKEQTKTTEKQTKKLQDLRKVFASFSTAAVIDADSTVIAVLTAQIAELNKGIESLESDDPLQSVLIANVIELEKRLQAARQQVALLKAELSGELVGPVIPDFVKEDDIKRARTLGDIIGNLPTIANNAAKKAREEIIKERDFRIQAATQAGGAIFDIVRQSQQAQQQALENRLRRGIISEEQYQQKLKEIRRKEAIAAKAEAIFQATINLAQAISTALARTGNPILAGIVAALAAAQLAAIVATPIPRFFKGVKNFMGGLAWVGDGGKHEVVRNPQGELSLTPNKPTLTYLPKGSDVFKDVPTFQREASIHAMRTPTLASMPVSDEVKARKEMVKLLKKGNAKYDEVLGLLRQGNKNTRQSVNELKTIKKHKQTFYV